MNERQTTPPLLDHQRRAIDFVLTRKPSPKTGHTNCYLALKPGLGKTACAAVVSEKLRALTIYVAPPFLVRNTEAEYNRWAPSLTVSILGHTYLGYEDPDVLIVPDSLIDRPFTTDVIAHLMYRKNVDTTLIIIDEAHRFKNTTAKRTRALLGHYRRYTFEPGLIAMFKRQVYMSGTPMPNRPMELYSILNAAAPETIDYMGEFQFGVKYCAGYKSRFGWDFTGQSNLKELAARVRYPSGPFMLRIDKDVLKLPPKIEEAFVVSASMGPRLAKLDSEIASRYKTADDIVKHAIAQKEGAEDLHVMTYRRLIGLEKVAAAAEYIKSIIDETSESLLVFAYHREVIDALTAALSKFHVPLVITGDTPVQKRQSIVHTFQTSDAHRIVLGNYLAMGVGFTLTKASRVLFVEFSWVPGDNSQASDRAHRIGQSQCVYVQYMVYQNSIDKRVLESTLEKQIAINQV